MDAIVSLAPPLAAALVDLDATYFVQMTMFLVLYILLSQVFFKPYVRRLRLRDQAGHGLRERAKDALRRAKELDEDAERRLTGAKQAAVLERRRLAEDGVALRDGIVTKERERAQARMDQELAGLEAEKARFMATTDTTAAELAALIDSQMQSVEAR
jgi:F0F1-type ATP synthase membrane subunit b/b'